MPHPRYAKPAIVDSSHAALAYRLTVYDEAQPRFVHLSLSLLDAFCREWQDRLDAGISRIVDDDDQRNGHPEQRVKVDVLANLDSDAHTSQPLACLGTRRQTRRCRGRNLDIL